MKCNSIGKLLFFVAFIIEPCGVPRDIQDKAPRAYSFPVFPPLKLPDRGEPEPGLQELVLLSGCQCFG
jgi:hypothetical protein